MRLDEIRKLVEAAPNDGDEQDWLDAWRTVGAALLAVAEAAQAHRDSVFDDAMAEECLPYKTRSGMAMDEALAALEGLKLP